MKVQVIFYSMYGHVWRMAEAVAQGAREVKEAEVSIYQVPELVPPEILEKSGALEAKKQFSHIPIAEPEIMAEADAVLFGTPTRYGNMASQMKNFLDRTGGLWAKNALVGKAAGVFTSTATQHGGQETTIISTIIPLLHLGFIIVGLPYLEQRQMTMSEITGGSPYGASTIAGTDGSRLPSENELAMARFQGRYTAEIAQKLRAR
jgi:NAD(P)H dehydrogenase (quinone)